jgi:rhodanese-related sulfurtransferase
MSTATIEIGVESTMNQIMETYPGAQRSLFRKYHIGGCSSCAFKPEETLTEVCERNGSLVPGEILAQIQASHKEDAKIFISPEVLKKSIDQRETLKLLDIRSRPEFDAVKIEGSELMSQKTTQDIMAYWAPEDLLVIIDHQGKQGLDAAAYFLGHGLKNVCCLLGGIDAWSKEIDPSVRRYKLG